jgi:hypothetical protein
MRLQAALRTLCGRMVETEAGGDVRVHRRARAGFLLLRARWLTRHGGQPVLHKNEFQHRRDRVYYDHVLQSGTSPDVVGSW